MVFFVTFAIVKRHLFIGMALLMVLTSCHSPQREARLMVRRAERLFESDPDSTTRLIDSVLRMPAYFKEGKRMDIALMQAKALFSNRGQEIPPLMDDEFFDERPFLTTSPELERAADYYARKKKYDKAAHAALYSGFVQQHYGDKAAAMQSFKDAEHYGGKAGDSLLVAQAQCLMGEMLYNDGMEQEALVMLKNSECGFGNCYVEKALVQNMAAVCYLVLGDFENAAIFLQQSLLHSQKGHVEKVKRKVLNNYAVFYRLQGKHDQSIACLQQIANEPNLTNSETLLLYLNMGNSFAAIGETDSAILYFHRLEGILPEANVQNETKVSAYGALSRFAENQGDNSKALLWREKHEQFLYEVMSQRQEQNIYRIQRQYDYESMQNALNKRIIYRHHIILVISILLFISTIIILFLQYRHKQMMEAEEEMKQQIDAMKHDLRQTVKFSVMDEEVALRLRMILTAQRITQQAKDPKNEWRPLMLQVMNGKKDLFEAAQTSVEMAYPNLYAILAEKYPNLTETETKICLLSFCDISNAEMAELLGLRLNTINQNRSTLRKKLNLDFDKMKEQMRDVLAN